MRGLDRSQGKTKYSSEGTPVDFNKVGFVYVFWYKLFIKIEEILPFSILRKYVFKKTKDFSDKWVLVHTVLSFISLVTMHYFSLGYVSNIIVFYAFIRILEIVIYQINVLLFHPYKMLIIDNKVQYKIQNTYRSVVLLGHNFLEVIFWFTCVSNFFNKPNDRLIYTLMDNTVRIFTFSYEKPGITNDIIQFVFFIEVICGIVLTIISLAKFLGELPHQNIKLEKTKNTQSRGDKNTKARFWV